jgi:hypothetical protein
LHLVIPGIAVALVLGSADVCSAQPADTDDVASDVADDPLYGTGPVEPVPTEDGGYFPTIEETMLLGGDYLRMGTSNQVTDGRNQRAQDLTPAPYPGQTYQAPWAQPLSPLNPFLGFFDSHQALVAEDNGMWPRGASFEFDSSFPLLVREFNPERAMVKAGPTYFDLLFVGMTVLHSDYQGDKAFSDDNEDGWLMGIEFGLRGLVQFTDQFYLSLAATLVYLPLDNDVGFRLGAGGAPTAGLTLDYRFEKGDWDLRLYDSFFGSYGYDVFAGLDDEGFQQAGRYNFGFRDAKRTGDVYDGENAYFTNTVGFDSTTPVGQDWRFWFSAKRADTWRSLEFEDHLAHSSLFSRIGYNGHDVGFSPAFEYYMDHYEYPNGGDSTLSNRIYFTLRGRLTENLRLEGRAGYLWMSGSDSYDDSYLYSVDLTHEISRYTTHSISAGRDYFSYDVTGDSTVSDYVRYRINHAFNKEFTGLAWVQYSDDEGRSFDGDRTNVTAILRWALFNGNSSAINLRGAYEHRDGLPGGKGDRWLGRLSYTQNFFSRTFGEIFYQYEESSGFRSFNEQVFGSTVRRHF